MNGRQTCPAGDPPINGCLQDLASGGFHTCALKASGEVWCWGSNVVGQLNVFEAMRESGRDARIQIAGSSEEYGLVHPEEAPQPAIAVS